MSSTVCQICSANNWKYCCPKCNIFFCSSECYRNEKHSQCSEKFFRDSVLEEFAARAAEEKTPEENIKINEILQKYKSDDPMQGIEPELLKEFESVDSDDDDDDKDGKNKVDLVDRLKDVNIDNPEEVWQQLTTEERKEFEDLVDSGDITKIVPEYKPWWKNKEEIRLVQEIKPESDENAAANPDDEFEYPKIIESIVPFPSICRDDPNPCLYNSMVNILTAYACTVRYFNGEHYVSYKEAVNYLISLSANLKKRESFYDKELAIKSVILEALAENLEIYTDDVHLIKEDVEDILEGCVPGKCEVKYTLAALSDIYRLFKITKRKCFSENEKEKTETEAKERFSSKFAMEKYRTSLIEVDKEKINIIIKKLEFYISFIKSKQ